MIRFYAFDFLEKDWKKATNYKFYFYRRFFYKSIETHYGKRTMIDKMIHYPKIYTLNKEIIKK